MRIRMKTPVILNFHELYYPVEASLSGLWSGIPHKTHFRSLLKIANRSVFTYRTALEEWLPHIPKSAALPTYVPVGSNIEPTTRFDRHQKKEKLVVVHFGGLHPTINYENIFAAIGALKAEIPMPVEARFLGITDDQLGELLKKHEVEFLRHYCNAFGYLAPEEISQQLFECDVYLTSYEDGVSTRRGTFLAGMAHGCAIVTTKGRNTSGEVPWRDFCVMAEASDSAAYAARAVDLGKGGMEARIDYGIKARMEYTDRFSFKTLASRWEEMLMETN